MYKSRLLRVRERVSVQLDAILQEFKPGAKITVLVRTPGKPDADFILGDDALEDVAAAIGRRMTDPTTVVFEAGKVDDA